MLSVSERVEVMSEWGPRHDDGDERYEMAHSDTPETVCGGVAVGEVTEFDGEHDATYVGRDDLGRGMHAVPLGERGCFGNPFTLDEYDRADSLAKYEEALVERLASDEEFRAAVSELHGDVLLCHCRRVSEDEPACHADVLAAWASRLYHDEVRFR